MDFSQLDWPTLDRLRDAFLSGAAANGPYWRSRDDLSNYDLTYARRIGWKWDAVLSELRHRNWSPPSRTLLDWGCGSGVASRRVLRAFGAENFDTLLLWDHSPLARDYAAEIARRDFPNLRVEAPPAPPSPRPSSHIQSQRGGSPPPPSPIRSCGGGSPPRNISHPSDQPAPSTLRPPHSEIPPQSALTLVLSHVINELPPPALAELLALARRADAIIWVEPGTHAASRALVAVREQLRGDFRIIAPCPHEAPCGLLAADAARHWCHNFADPPPNIHADSNWVKFGKRAGIDLRSLPYSFLALEKKHNESASPVIPQSAFRNPHSEVSRIIGRPRFHKAHAAICACDHTGVRDLTLYKRADPDFFKTLERAPAHPPLHVFPRAPAPRRAA